MTNSYLLLNTCLILLLLKPIAFIAFLLRLLSAVHFHGSMAQIFLSPGTWLPNKIPFHSMRAAWCWHVVLGVLPCGLSLVFLRLVPPLPPYSEGCCQGGWLSASSRDLSPCRIPDTRVFTNYYFITLCFSTTLLFSPLYNPGQDLCLFSSLPQGYQLCAYIFSKPVFLGYWSGSWDKYGRMRTSQHSTGRSSHSWGQAFGNHFCSVLCDREFP